MAAVYQREALLRGGAEVLEGVRRYADEGLQGLLRREAVLRDLVGELGLRVTGMRYVQHLENEV